MTDNIQIGKKVCPKCGGKKRIQEKNGTIRACWDCMADDDQHGKPKDTDIKI